MVLREDDPDRNLMHLHRFLSPASAPMPWDEVWTIKG